MIAAPSQARSGPVRLALTRSQAYWLMFLCAQAARSPLHVRARRTNTRTYGQVVQAMADANDRKRRS